MKYKQAARESCLIVCAAVLLGFSYAFLTGKGLFGKQGLSSGVSVDTSGTAPTPISLAAAKELFDNRGAVFVDARHQFDYRRGHIPSSVNIPLTDFDSSQDAVATLPRDKTIIVYCDGSECNSSIELAAKLYEKGISGIRIFFGGWQEWTANHFPTESSE